MPGKIGDRKALVVGSTGLVGRYVLQELFDHVSYTSIEVFLRRPHEYNRLHVHEHVIDFSRLEDFAHLFTGDDLFLCLGTTIKKAGSVTKMEEIDRDIPIRIAQMAFANGATRVAVVSSIGANAASKNYYLRIKGEMEDGIRMIPFTQIVIARPSILFGKRSEFRFGEIIGKGFMRVAGIFLLGPLRKYRGIHGRSVAIAMMNLIKSRHRDIIYESDVLQKFRKR
jgi:uncharacterized protein YbjT (DUF2867 family)